MNSLLNLVINNSDNKSSDFIFNILKIENFNKNSNSRLRFWFDFVRENFNKIEGDIFEFGVFRGASLISMAILLKKIGSNKKVYGFDSFEGFPRFHEFDKIEVFNKNPELFSELQIKNFKILNELEKQMSKISISDNSFASNFTQTSYNDLLKKIEILELDNIELVKGDFKDSIPDFFESHKNRIFSINIDCDLYEGYKLVFENCWSKLNYGAYVHLDEYFSLRYPGAKIATDQFIKNRNDVLLKNNKNNFGEFERWGLIKK